MKTQINANSNTVSSNVKAVMRGNTVEIVPTGKKASKFAYSV